MAAPYFYLYNETTAETLSLDDTVQEISFGGTKRNFEIVEFTTSNGGVVRGTGNYSPKQFKLLHTEKVESGDVNAWNSRRNDLMAWFTKPVYQNIWLYIQDGEQTMTLRTQVYCTQIGEDKFETLLMAKEKEFVLVSPSGIWERTTATTSTTAITGATEQQIRIVNNSSIEIVPLFKFTPSGLCDSFQVKTTEGYGFILSGNFLSGVEIIFNMKNGVLTFDGSAVNVAHYLIGGSPFSIPKGTNILYVKTSIAGSFTCEYYERYL